MQDCSSRAAYPPAQHPRPAAIVGTMVPTENHFLHDRGREEWFPLPLLSAC